VRTQYQHLTMNLDKTYECTQNKTETNLSLGEFPADCSSPVTLVPCPAGCSVFRGVALWQKTTPLWTIYLHNIWQTTTHLFN